jgi:hypothetical protein
MQVTLYKLVMMKVVVHVPYPDLVEVVHVKLKVNPNNYLPDKRRIIRMLEIIW